MDGLGLKTQPKQSQRKAGRDFLHAHPSPLLTLSRGGARYYLESWNSMVVPPDPSSPQMVLIAQGQPGGPRTHFKGLQPLLLFDVLYALAALLMEVLLLILIQQANLV